LAPLNSELGQLALLQADAYPVGAVGQLRNARFVQRRHKLTPVVPTALPSHIVGLDVVVGRELAKRLK
jgi:hypothetical protein